MIVDYQGKRRQVLVIDDRWENRVVLSTLLELVGFTVFEAEQGQAGLDILNQGTPDLVITDLIMPGIDGYDFLATVRQSEPIKTIKMIATSATINQNVQNRAFKAGCDAFYQSPLMHRICITRLLNCCSWSGFMKLYPRDKHLNRLG